MNSKESTPESAVDLSAQLAHGLAVMNLELSRTQREKLLAYLTLLYKWNRAYSLTALKEQDKAVSHHLLDSLSVLRFVPDGRLLDVGSGGGAPGIPLAIARPELPVTLLDSNSKKAAFLRQAAIELELTNVSVHGGRVEQYHPEFGYTAIVSRAFAELSSFATLSGHLLAPDGVWLAMKGVWPHDEIARLADEARVEAVHPLCVAGVDGERHLVVMRHVAE
jgi:16S rRNA (guanine527-N7)-methyltransferase